jgi:hypothetical protein
MSSTYSILLLPVITLALIAVCTRNDWVAIAGRPVARFCAGIWEGLSRLLAIRVQQDRRWFLIGAAAGVTFDVFCTLASHGRLGDLESIGFPFPFRTVGGYVYTVYYSSWALLADIVVLGLLALVGGYAAIGVRRIGREGRDKGLRTPNQSAPPNPAKGS